MQAAYRRSRIIAMLLAILVLILADHLSSPTFAFNMGDGHARTSLNQRDANACAPCGAPCPSTRE
ncbi:hypothetical protein LCL99_03505 [Halomonas denitrificans]|uniref:hypothetical protein n=1 Tax=Halomonas TaxID=2745 RepID=UPI001A909B27|nr:MULTISPECIES: hypothetical protein [Halomonas]MED5296631.1 hypothetical protein [Pseudomonadota bacterium]MBN8411379.1 hypothetical protein [Halomonas litopenaei]MBY5925997.1 hypothetical protein [Halomonas sp. DP4Y7-2]MBY5927728.1 hypothetical protein [Halomonas sp. DP8Y7-3]MBY5969815.1 hypothetical protein [Halomonas denitrificans]